ncbi:MAG: imidazolonepropionase, partial [Cyclobacteriaceae bacterium]|nr:imidazolonepropionase [Cyclobacteriaceae bacterium]
MNVIVKNIKGVVQYRKTPVNRLYGKDMSDLPIKEDAFILVRKGKIARIGKMSEFEPVSGIPEIDATGKYVFPLFVDSHTHLVFPASRESEFVDKINGLSYSEIAARGGGILNSAKAMAEVGESQLFDIARERAMEVLGFGTGTIEIKSGYGLNLENELKMLRVAKKLGEETPLTVKTTFLGAHAVPAGMRKEKYIELIINEMIPAVTAEGLADYIDVFCEENFFTLEETIRIVEEGKKYGLKPKIHANQLNNSGGVQAGIATGAISVDHLEAIGEAEIELLKSSKVMPTLLPGAAFYLRTPYPPARDMIEQGLSVALATDFNPGSSPCGSMQMMLSLACIGMRMTPAEAINAATVNAAFAM